MVLLTPPLSLVKSRGCRPEGVGTLGETAGYNSRIWVAPASCRFPVRPANDDTGVHMAKDDAGS